MDALLAYSADHCFSVLTDGSNGRADRDKLEAASREATQKKISVDDVLNIAGTFAKGYRQRTATLLKRLLSSNPELQQTIIYELPTVFEVALDSGKAMDRLAHTLVSLCMVSSDFYTACGQSTAFAKVLANQIGKTAAELRKNSSRDRSYIALPLSKATQTLLQTVFDLTMTLFACLAAAYSTLDDAKLSQMSALVADLTEDTITESSIALLESEFNFGEQLQSTASPSLRHDARLEYVVATFVSSTSPLDFSPRDILRQQNNRRQSKGKGRAVPAQVENSSLDTAVQQIRDIFPEQDPAQLKRHFQSPRFQSAGGNFDTEKLTAAILEGTLPTDDFAAPEIAPAASTPKARAFERSNIFDEQPLDEGSILARRQEKDPGMTDDVKKRIMALIEANEIAEREALYGPDEEYRPMPLYNPDEPVEYDEDDWGAPIRVIERDNESESEIGEDEEISPSTDFTPKVVEVLSRAYIEHGLELLLRPKSGQKSRLRESLMHDLTLAGWQANTGEDLIDGWARMLDRDPNKTARLAPFEFAGNKRETSQSTPHGNQQQDSSRGGGRGRGRGRGGQKYAHDRRKRGHDKKMAKGMAG